MSMLTLAGHTRSASRPEIRVPNATRLFLAACALCIFAPMLCLAASFVTGGPAVAEVLWAYACAVLMESPVLLISVALCAMALVFWSITQIVGLRMSHGTLKAQMN